MQITYVEDIPGPTDTRSRKTAGGRGKMAKNGNLKSMVTLILHLLTTVSLLLSTLTCTSTGNTTTRCHRVPMRKFYSHIDRHFSPSTIHNQTKYLRIMPTYDSQQYISYEKSKNKSLFRNKKIKISTAFTKLNISRVDQMTTTRGPGGGRGGGGSVNEERKGPGRRWPAKVIDSSQSSINFVPAKDLSGSQTTTPKKKLTQLPLVSPDKDEMMVDVTKPPVMTGISKEPTKQVETISTEHITRVQYRKKVKNSPNVIELMTNLAACFMQYNKTVQLMPYDDNCKSNPIITPRDIPTEVDEFAIYVPSASVSRRDTLFMKFRIKSDMSLFKLKKLKES